MIALRGLSLPILFCAAGILACGGDSSMPANAPASAASADAGPPVDRWGTYRSKRFSLVLRLPGGASEWRVDDRSRAELVAIHTPTRSRLVAARWAEVELQNRSTCETLARRRGLLPPTTLRVVEESAAIRPDGDDVRIWVALEPGPAESAPIRGHAMAVGARARKCWAAHYVTEVASSKDDVELSTRLALVREGTLAHVEVEGIEEIQREGRGR